MGDQYRVLAGGHRSCLSDRRGEPLSPFPESSSSSLIGFLVGRGEFTFTVALIAATAGAVGGGRALYALGVWLGWDRLRNFVRRHGTWLMVTEDDVDKADRFFDVMAPRWCSSVGLLRGWKRGVDPGGGLRVWACAASLFPRRWARRCGTGPDRHRLCAGKQLAEAQSYTRYLEYWVFGIQGRKRDPLHRAPPARTLLVEGGYPVSWILE